ncbi:MAG: repressor LexA [Nevskia sp.]|nr:repressor LexA [Nevskia sp.]
MPLTGRQQQIVDFLRQYQAREGMPPTQAEIAARFGFTQKAAGDHLKLIAAKGVIEIRRDIPRGIRFADRKRPNQSGMFLPLVERVAAGPPVLAGGQFDQLLPIAPAMFRPPADYLRRAVGNSMAGMGIQDGDLIGVKQTAAAENDQVIVAKLFSHGGIELTVRRLRRKGDMAWLLSGDDRTEPLLFALHEGPDGAPLVEIEGLYCGHFHPHTG